MRIDLTCHGGSFAVLVAVLATAGAARAEIKLEHLWTHGAGGRARAEIVAYDQLAGQLLVVNGDQRCVTQLDLRTGRELGRLDVSRWGDPTSVAASRNIAPEGLAFIPAETSPLGEPLLAVACEVTGTTILFRVHTAR
jgi:hypothetical protein